MLPVPSTGPIIANSHRHSNHRQLTSPFIIATQVLPETSLKGKRPSKKKTNHRQTEEINYEIFDLSQDLP